MKKIISLILSLVMILSTFSVATFAADSEPDTVTVYVTVSKYGEIIEDKNGNLIAMTPIELSGKETYSLDDAFVDLHDELCEASVSGYETAIGDYGLYISKFWEDESGNFTYQVNFGEENVWGPTHEIENGDHIEFCINKNTYPDTEVYTKFNKSTAEISSGESIDLILNQGEYTADGLAFSPCQDAVITINSVATENITDVNGEVSILFDECGEYIVSAAKTKLVGEETVTAIEAPVCLVTVKNDASTDVPTDAPEDDTEVDLNYVTPEEVIENIVGKYLNDSIVNDGNMHWFIADFASYFEIQSESQYSFTDTQKQACVDKIIATADSSSSQGDLAKAIIALRALGYDAKNTYRKDGTTFDIVAKLTSLITEESVEAPYYEYTLPYVLIALGQGENYACAETIDFLINTAIEKKSAWQDTSWGTDGAAPMLLALMPYYENADINAVVDETVQLIKAFQGSDGSMGNAASTGLAMAGLSAAGINPETILKDEKSLIDGLMSQINDNFDGFLPGDNSFGTEQGLRGLVAWKLCNNGKKLYDFKDYPKNEARATLKPVSKPVFGGGGSYDKKEKEDEKEETKDPEIVEETLLGLSGKSEDVKILSIIFEEKTFADIEDHKNQEAIETLAQRGIINGKNEKSYAPDETMSRAEFATIVVRGLGLPKKNDKTFDDVEENDWFKEHVGTAYSYGIVNGVSEKEFNPYGKITREEAATMILRAAKLCGMDTNISDVGVRNTLSEFTDYVQASDWAMKALAFCFNEEILDKSVIEVKPKTEVTRAEIAQILYNMLERSKLL